jgi:pimeloyl-ACP methyl ester carboxylesterase
MSAPFVVMVPGLGLGEAACAVTLARLPGASRVVRLPGYGCPADRDADLAPAALAGALMRAVGDVSAPVVLVGHSASCQVVAEAAARFPASVSAIVLIGPTTDPRGASWSGLAQRWLRTAFWERPWQVPLLVREYARTGPRSMLRAMDAARSHPLHEALAACRVPILVLRGRHDRIAPEDWCRRLPGGDAVTLRAGGHMIPLTHGFDVARAIDAWLTRIAASSR